MGDVFSEYLGYVLETWSGIWYDAIFLVFFGYYSWDIRYEGCWISELYGSRFI